MPRKIPARKKPCIPSLRRCNGRGFVELAGVRHYLGPWGDPSTEEAYGRKIAEWLEAGRRLPVAAHEITIVELADRYFEHATGYYRRPDGRASSTLDIVRETVRTLARLYGRSLAGEFGPLALRAVRQEWIAAKLARSTVNCYVRNVRAMFRWGVSNELVAPTTLHALEAVQGLRKGRSEARETEHVAPVSPRHIDAVRAHCSRQVAAMIDLQLLTGARAGEIVGLRPCDIDTIGDVWIVSLADHKTAHWDKTRMLHLGPRAQAILRPFMLRPANLPMFSPREAEAERHADAEMHRRPNQKTNPRKTPRRVGHCYTVASYRRAIERGCKASEVDVWTPHRLRHTVATDLRKRFGLEAAQVVLGHSNVGATQIYAQRDEAKAAEIAREVG